ncbi:MAG: bifunctional gluaredoxin/ribonucleoside-diphosphate [Podoviridae sp. ctbj_2]|nr:MAG: bifunctional gluaredoxin/ribonucleoside-diphosphate [Podoviridae sp. ctbj_2]
MSVFERSVVYAPIYPEFVEITKVHEEAHWHEGEAKLHQDVEDWKLGRLTQQEKNFVSSILRLFTQSDVAVGSDYYDNLIPVFKNNETRNMLGSFAGREGTHQRAYALLNDTLGFGADFYYDFLKYKSMKDKVEFMLDMKNNSPEEVIKSIAKQVLIEGVCLFASFAMLLNFQRRGLLMGMGDVNQWSIKDESIHVHGLGRLFHQCIREHPRVVTDDFKREIYSLAREVVSLEDAFIDQVYEETETIGDEKHFITKDQTKQYIRSVADYRMEQLGFKKEYGVSNPFDWLDWVTSNSTLENFFENNTVGYSKNSMVGEYANGY